VFASGSGGGLSGGGGLGNILSNIDLPGLLQGVNSFVKLIGAFCPPLSQDFVTVTTLDSLFASSRNVQMGGTASSSSSEIDDDTANTIAKRHVRVARETAAESAAADQEGAESAPQPEQDSNGVDDQDRNKRYSPFGASDDGHEGAGSGNFLFDIIRLVAGSGATEESDDHEAGGVAELDVQKSTDGHTEGIPGPITRLFVIANRGLANLVQDLILRLAQTSERLVNFKARLITALI
ncbi:hypothetical protein YQE_11439, partial [Dendroctonus ponderosae]